MICFFAAGCTTTSKNLNTLSVDMTKEEVTKRIGKPFAIQHPKRDESKESEPRAPDKDISETWEYHLVKYKGTEQSVMRGVDKVVEPIFSFGMSFFAPHQTEADERAYALYFNSEGRLLSWKEVGAVEEKPKKEDPNQKRKGD